MNSRCTTSQDGLDPFGQLVATDGTRYGMRAAAIFFFARVIRAAIVDSLTRNARATSAVRQPADQPQGQRDLRLAAPGPGGSR